VYNVFILKEHKNGKEAMKYLYVYDDIRPPIHAADGASKTCNIPDIAYVSRLASPVP
jgi:hypothetical protein